MSTSTDPASGPRHYGKALGSLEFRLMNTLWESSVALSVQDVCAALGANANYKTVMTVLNRLVEKGLLTRDLNGRAYHYQPRLKRDQFLESMARDLVTGFVTAYGPKAGRYIAEATENIATDPDRLLSSGPYEKPSASIPPFAILAVIGAIAQTVLYLCSRHKKQ